MTIAYPLESMKRKLTPKDVLKRERARTQREKLVAKLELQLRAAKLPEWEREYKFHPERGWRFDLAWPSCDDQTFYVQTGIEGVAVEVEGAIWTNGRHVRGTGFIADCEKYNEATLMGWLLLRIPPEHIESGQALDWICRALNCK